MHEQILEEISNSNDLFRPKTTFISNRTQKVCVYSVVPLLFFSALSYATTFYSSRASEFNILATIFSAISFLLVMFFVLIYQWAVFIPDLIKTMKNPVKNFLDDNVHKLNGVITLSNSLSRYSKEDLEFVLSITRLETQHLKSRLCLLIGKIETVGILPLIVTTIVSGYSIITDEKMPYVTWVAYGLLSLYVFLFPYNLLVHKLELIIFSLEDSIKTKERAQHSKYKRLYIRRPQ